MQKAHEQSTKAKKCTHVDHDKLWKPEKNGRSSTPARQGYEIIFTMPQIHIPLQT